VARTLEPLLAGFGPEPSSDQVLSLNVCDPAMGSGAFLVEACRYLGERLLEAWTREGRAEALRAKEDDALVYARRLVAERCLYGVDKNPFAVELAKLSLWLVTLQRQKPFTFLDHNLRCGDSLVGCSFEQITAFHWKPGAQMGFFEAELEQSLDEALRARAVIIEKSPEDTPEANRAMRTAMEDADDALSRIRIIGDLLVGAFFSADTQKARENERLRRLELVRHWLGGNESAATEVASLAAEARVASPPFHWMFEFPEVFYADRVDPLGTQSAGEAAYLDAVLGNPPFAGTTAISTSGGPRYFPWLKTIFAGDTGVRGKCDLCAFFFRRAAELIGTHGTIGLIATNTIAQGDTRSIGLKHILSEGLIIYNATESIEWPGEAAVTISVVHLANGTVQETVQAKRLNDHVVQSINSRLRPKPERSDPVQLRENDGLASAGTYVLGMGFTLIQEEYEELIARSAANAERIFPYLGGEELNTSTTQDFHRYVISFGQMSLEEAGKWPDLLSIVREKVKPERDRLKENSSTIRGFKRRWWRHANVRPALYQALSHLERCLVTARVSKHLCFSFQPSDRIFSEATNVFALDKDTSFAVLQSRVHEPWARLLSSSLEDRLRYAATDCFETFPFPKPDPKAVIPALEDIGERLYETRAQFMVDTNQGLTKTYNALKDPTVHDPRVEELRQLHIEMDQAVLAAYAEHTGDKTWLDIDVPPYTDPQTPAEESLHQTFQDEILDHLFALNEQRANR
jgi:hypothetical protein